VPTAHSNSVPTPFISDNPPPFVRILDFFKSILDSCPYESILIIHQDLYPARSVDAEVFDSTHDGQDDPTGNDDGDQGAPSAEPTVPHLIRSDTAVQVRPSAVDQLTTKGQRSSEEETPCASFQAQTSYTLRSGDN
jgi:hypothetical protein